VAGAAFALTVQLSEARYFSWRESADEIAIVAKRTLNGADPARRKAAWAEAYRTTPHGRPVQLPDGI
jgi:hypothetical protein